MSIKDKIETAEEVDFPKFHRITKSEFCRKMKALRKKQISLNDQMADLFESVMAIGVDLNVASEASQADNIGDAISCYISYGEYFPEKIWEEMKNETLR